MINKAWRFIYFTFIDLVRWKPIMLTSTHEKIVNQMGAIHQAREDHYWKQFALSGSWERKYLELNEKYQKIVKVGE